jgi:pilus assembly protein CpaE
MRAVVISPDNAVASRIESVLQKWSWDCRNISTTDLHEMRKQLINVKPDVVIAVQPTQQDFDDDLKELKCHVKSKLVVVGPPDPRQILHLLHNCGVDEYLNEEDLEKEVEALLRRSRNASSGKVIAVFSPSPGAGSATVAANMATTICATGTKCAVIDLNLATGDLSALLDVKPKHSLADLERNISLVDETIFTQLLTFAESGVAMLAAPLKLDEIPAISVKSVVTAISMARTLYPFVVIDIQPGLYAEQLAALEMASVILIVLEMDFCSLRSVSRVLEYLAERGIQKSAVRLIANRTGQVEQLSQRQVETALSLPIDLLIPEDRKVVTRSANTGIPFVIGFPRSQIAQQIEQYTKELMKNL